MIDASQDKEQPADLPEYVGDDEVNINLYNVIIYCKLLHVCS